MSTASSVVSGKAVYRSYLFAHSVLDEAEDESTVAVAVAAALAAPGMGMVEQVELHDEAKERVAPPDGRDLEQHAPLAAAEEAGTLGERQAAVEEDDIQDEHHAVAEADDAHDEVQAAAGCVGTQDEPLAVAGCDGTQGDPVAVAEVDGVPAAAEEDDSQVGMAGKMVGALCWTVVYATQMAVAFVDSKTGWEWAGTPC